MANARSYRDLEAWRSGMELVEGCYRLSSTFPNHERFGLTVQLRRAAISIPSNLAEGACRHTTNAFVNHVSIALGSHAEVETCLEIAFRLGYLSVEERTAVATTAESTGRLLNGLMRALRSRLRQPPTTSN
jgi:four helix bundle protein